MWHILDSSESSDANRTSWVVAVVSEWSEFIWLSNNWFCAACKVAARAWCWSCRCCWTESWCSLRFGTLLTGRFFFLSSSFVCATESFEFSSDFSASLSLEPPESFSAANCCETQPSYCCWLGRLVASHCSNCLFCYLSGRDLRLTESLCSGHLLNASLDCFRYLNSWLLNRFLA